MLNLLCPRAFSRSRSGHTELWSVVLTLSLFGLCTTELYAQESKPVTDPDKLFEPRSYADQDGNVLNYRLLKPLDYDPTEKYPLVVFLHGAGERGDDNTAQLNMGCEIFVNQGGVKR